MYMTIGAGSFWRSAIQLKDPFCTTHTRSRAQRGCCTCHVLGIRGENHFSQQGSKGNRLLFPLRGPSYYLGGQDTFALQQAGPLSYKPPTSARAVEIQNYSFDAIWRHACCTANVLVAVAQRRQSHEVGTSAATAPLYEHATQKRCIASSIRPPAVIAPPPQPWAQQCWPRGGGIWHTLPPFPWMAVGSAKPPGTPRQSAAPPRAQMPSPPASR